MKFEEIIIRKKGYRSFGEEVILKSEHMFTNSLCIMFKFKRCLSSVVVEYTTGKFVLLYKKEILCLYERCSNNYCL